MWLIVAGAELAIGDVQEVGVADELTQEVPGLAVDLVVGDVAVVGLGVNRDGPVRADRDAGTPTASDPVGDPYYSRR